LLLLNRLQTEREKEDEVVEGAVPQVDCQLIPVEENDYKNYRKNMIRKNDAHILKNNFISGLETTK
jgi:hypothetical protein